MPNHAEAKKQATQQWSEVRARVKLQLANQQYKHGLFAECAASATEAVGLDATLGDAYAVLAKADLELGRTASAEQALEAACERNLSSPELHYLNGVVLELRDELPAALDRYEQAVRSDNRNADYMMAYAECLVSLDRSADALSLLDANALRLDNAAGVWALAGHLAELRGDSPGAIERYGKALALAPAQPLIAERLAGLLIAGKRHEEAISLLKPLVTKEGSENAGARRALARCYLEVNDAPSAQALLAEYVRVHPKDEAALRILAEAGLQTGDLLTVGWAVDHLRKAHPRDITVELLYASLLWKRGDLAGAASLLTPMTRSNPDNAAALYLLGVVLEAQEQYEAARECFQQAVALEPERALVLDDPTQR